MNKITPFLWFNNEAEDAANFYFSIFPDAKKTDELRWGPGGQAPEGSLLTISIELAGQEMTFMNGGPSQKLTEAFSFSLACRDQAEIDDYWEKLEGTPLACGWIKDKFGLCWQVVPENIAELVSHPASMKAMMSMIKLDVAVLEAAAKS